MNNDFDFSRVKGEAKLLFDHNLAHNLILVVVFSGSDGVQLLMEKIKQLNIGK